MDRKSRQRKEAQLWSEIQDLIGKASKWPQSIRELFWKKNLNYFNRFKFVTFCFVNGLYPQLDIGVKSSSRTCVIRMPKDMC